MFLKYSSTLSVNLLFYFHNKQNSLVSMYTFFLTFKGGEGASPFFCCETRWALVDTQTKAHNQHVDCSYLPSDEQNTICPYLVIRKYGHIVSVFLNETIYLKLILGLF